METQTNETRKTIAQEIQIRIAELKETRKKYADRRDEMRLKFSPGDLDRDPEFNEIIEGIEIIDKCIRTYFNINTGLMPSPCVPNLPPKFRQYISDVSDFDDVFETIRMIIGDAANSFNDRNDAELEKWDSALVEFVEWIVTSGSFLSSMYSKYKKGEYSYKLLTHALTRVREFIHLPNVSFETNDDGDAIYYEGSLRSLVDFINLVDSNLDDSVYCAVKKLRDGEQEVPQLEQRVLAKTQNASLFEPRYHSYTMKDEYMVSNEATSDIEDSAGIGIRVVNCGNHIYLGEDKETGRFADVIISIPPIHVGNGFAENAPLNKFIYHSTRTPRTNCCTGKLNHVVILLNRTTRFDIFGKKTGDKNWNLGEGNDSAMQKAKEFISRNLKSSKLNVPGEVSIDLDDRINIDILSPIVYWSVKNKITRINFYGNISSERFSGICEFVRRKVSECQKTCDSQHGSNDAEPVSTYHDDEALGDEDDNEVMYNEFIKNMNASNDEQSRLKLEKVKITGNEEVPFKLKYVNGAGFPVSCSIIKNHEKETYMKVFTSEYACPVCGRVQTNETCLCDPDDDSEYEENTLETMWNMLFDELKK